MNKIATVFGRDSIRDFINKEIKKGNIVRIKNRSPKASEGNPTVGNAYSNGTSATDNDTTNPSKSQEKFSPQEKIFSTRNIRYLELAKEPEKNRAEMQSMVDEAAEAGENFGKAGESESNLSEKRFSTKNIVDSEGNSLSEQQAEYFKDSKIRDENGNLRVVYHGTNTGDFTVFDPKYIGMSSGDDGFFGKGFYFAYSRGEAAYYGAKRIIEAYLNIKNPFDFEKNFQMYDGNKTGQGYAHDAIQFMNFSKLFPEIAKNITIDVVEKGSNEYKTIGIIDFSKELEAAIKDTHFEVQKVKSNYGEEWVALADKFTKEYVDRNGVKREFTDYRYKQNFYSEKDARDQLFNAYNYLEKVKYSSIDMYSFTRLILDNNDEFTEALKGKGYDGTIQSEYGDEAVAFYPEQIKNIDNKAPTENKDIRYSARNFGLEEFNKESLNNIKMRGGVIVSDDNELDYHITKALSTNDKINLYLGAVSEETKDKIESELDTNIFIKPGQYTYSISYDDVRHISKHYSSNAEIIETVKILFGMLNEHDSIKEETLKGGQIRIILKKALPNADYLTVSIVSSKRRTLDLTTIYITKKNKSGDQLNQPDISNVNDVAQLESNPTNNSISITTSESQEKNFSTCNTRYLTVTLNWRRSRRKTAPNYRAWLMRRRRKHWTDGDDFIEFFDDNGYDISLALSRFNPERALFLLPD